MNAHQARSGAAQHTAGPWALHKGSYEDFAWVIPASHADRLIGGSSDMDHDRDDYAQQIAASRCDVHGRGNAVANAAHIVKCVNLHDELLKALREISETVVYAPEGGHEEVAECVRIARAALEKAGAA